ncbi:MAG: hypothetical protein HC827_00550 [Cyanobacteria bacterium RM1_2_2]|nr:hypothetical protein [Cyanobacteria bacterium RM1_2_2]
MDQATERIESLKAGWVGAVATAIEFVAASALQVLAHLPATNGTAANGIEHWMQPETLGSAAIAVLSGGLFGITYRYVVRTDSNLQLQAGAVGAFGLVRGLGQIEATWATSPYWLTGIRLLASLLMFATAALLLNWSMRQGWIKRFEES